MAKRGRKPSTKPKGYFYEKQEQAVLDYLQAETAQEKNAIYCEILKPAFKKMIESIIRRYKLYIPDEDFEDTFNDTLSFLLTKADKFQPGKYKAYSYYGTICRNYLTGRIQARAKALVRNPSYDSVSEEFENNLRYSEGKEEEDNVASEIVKKLIGNLKDMLDAPEKFELKENERKLGEALVALFENWEYVLTTDGSNKLNKNAILLYLRERTGLDTKGIRDNIRRFKKNFLLIKDEVIN